MKTAVFSAQPYDRESLEQANATFGFDLQFFDFPLTTQTVHLVEGFPAVSVFVNDDVNAEIIRELSKGGTRLIATRTAGFNHIDLDAAAEHGIVVVRVPAYSPNSVSEFTVGLILALARHIPRAYNRVRDGDFDLTGLVGFELRDKTVGVVGTGRIGTQLVKNLSGFGCRILAQDLYPSDEVRQYAEYVEPEVMARECDILCIMVPLTPETKHLINERTLPYLKDGVFLVNTSRGALLDTRAAIDGLKSGKISMLAIDVYEEESDLFYRDLSGEILHDDVFARLLTFPNVIVTGHQAYLTDHALRNIAETTLANIAEFAETGAAENAVTPVPVSA